jgi:Spy/CpxP family protein refolding chaperone
MRISDGSKKRSRKESGLRRSGMRKRRGLLVLAGLLFWSGLFLSAHGQIQRPPNRERIRENIHRLRLLRMTEALGLSEDQTAKIYPVASRIERDKQVILRGINGEMRRLQDLLAEANPDEVDLAASVVKIKQLRQSFQHKDREFEDFLAENLSPVQKAKYILFSAEFYRCITEGLRRQRPQGRDKRPS